MGATQTDKESGLGKWSFITVSILGAMLIIVLIWSLSRALNNSSVKTVDDSSPQGSVAPTNEAIMMKSALLQEEMERQYLAEQRTVPVIQAPVAAQPTVVPTNRQNDAIILQKTKAKVNQKLVDRMKQFIKDNPNRDNRDIEKQIKRRENQGDPTR